MFIMCSEMWNSVTIYGPRAEIARFRQRFIVPAPPGNWEGSTLSIDFSSIHYEDTWNFRDWGQEDSNCYSFAFDTSPNFPIVTFERLAELFPALAFDCECIADDDRSMGYGWFNPPPGGEDFRDDYEVPEGYWDGDGSKRSPADEQRDKDLVNAHLRMLKEADGDD